MEILNYTEFRKELSRNLNDDADILIVCRGEKKYVVVLGLDA